MILLLIFPNSEKIELKVLKCMTRSLPVHRVDEKNWLHDESSSHSVDRRSIEHHNLIAE